MINVRHREADEIVKGHTKISDSVIQTQVCLTSKAIFFPLYDMGIKVTVVNHMTF